MSTNKNTQQIIASKLTRFDTILYRGDWLDVNFINIEDNFVVVNIGLSYETFELFFATNEYVTIVKD